MRTIIDRGVEGILALLMAVMIALVSLSVVYRYALAEPIVWAEEVARLCLVWVSFLGVYLAQRRAQHIAVETVLRKLPARVQLLVRTITNLVLLGLMAVLILYGARYAVRFMDSTTPLLDIPLGLVYAALPLACLLVVIDLLANALNVLKRGWNHTSSDEA